jgi:L-asparaginase II
MDPISVTVVRGALAEARHRVHAVAVRHGKVIDTAGDPTLVTFMRSTAKPLQAVPLARARPELPRHELAIACASHEASDDQLAAVRGLLARAGADEEDLECGPEGGSKLRHNCSGKHAGMLLLARTRGWQHEGYRLPEHPLQRELLDLVAEAACVSANEVETATDGCGVVAYGLSLEAIARIFARLVGGELPGSEPVLTAMRRHPELVGGPAAPDTAIMQAVPGAIAKRGAEGVLCAGLPDGTGAVVKVEDGANRAAGPALACFLELTELRAPPLLNSRGDEVGRLFPSR